MSGPRFERLLASTALALILAAPIGAIAQEGRAPTPAAPSAQHVAETAAQAVVSAPALAPGATAASPGEAAAIAGAAALSASEAAPSAGTGETSEVAASPKDAAAAPTNPVVASEQTPDPLATLDPADRAVAEKIRDLLAAKTDKTFASKRERAAVESFYQARNLAPLWLDKGVA